MKIRLRKMKKQQKDYRSEWGWHIRQERPATRIEAFHTPRQVCRCPNCCSDPIYGDFYCGRVKASGYVLMLENFYIRGERR